MSTSGAPPAIPGRLKRNLVAVISSWIVGPLYGINICVFILCVHVLHMKGLKGANIMMLTVASVQFALATGHVITILVQLIRAFVGEADVPDGTWLYLLNQAVPEHVAQEVFYITNSLIGDAILIWRLWIIWDRNFWLSAPFVVLCIASGVAGYIALVDLSHLTPTDTVFVARVHIWLITTWCLSIATQFGATLLIGYRFWKSMKWSPMEIRASRLSVLWILVESGALYSVTTIFLLGFSSTSTACCTGVVFAAALGQISALCPTLIIVRAGLRGPNSSSTFTRAKGSINKSHNPPSRYNPRDAESRGQGGDSVVVHVEKATEICLNDLEARDGNEPIPKGRSLSPKPFVYVPGDSNQ